MLPCRCAHQWRPSGRRAPDSQLASSSAAIGSSRALGLLRGPWLQIELGQPGLAGAADFERQILLVWGSDHLLAQSHDSFGISINARQQDY
jgi:hypothetical protein